MPNKAAMTNQQFEKIKEFLLDNKELFKQGKRAGPYAKLFLKLEKNKTDMHPLIGRCFPASKFIQAIIGSDKVSLHMIPSKKLPFIEIDGEVYNTTHWFTKCKSTGTVYDPTLEQFIYDPYDKEFVKSLYDEAFTRDFGGKYHTDIHGNRIAIPSREVMGFVNKWNTAL